MTKPFNLERAIAGDPVQTRCGLSVVWGGYNPDAQGSQIAGWVGDCLESWSGDGSYYDDVPDHSMDLVMAPKKQRREVTLYWYLNDVGELYLSKLPVKNCIATTCTVVEWEE